MTLLSTLPPTWRAVLLTSAWFVTASSYLIMMVPASCFVEFSLSRDRIQDMCFWSGCEMVFLKPLGAVALAMLALGMVTLTLALALAMTLAMTLTLTLTLALALALTLDPDPDPGPDPGP